MYALILSLAILTSPVKNETFILELEAAQKAGLITSETRLDLAETAIKRPSALPPEWKARLKQHPIQPENATSILVSNLQERVRLGLKSLYQYPAELTYILDSETFPIRVLYNDESTQGLAQKVLEAAEYSWQTQIIDWGWYAPPLDTPELRYRLYVTSASGSGGYTAPIGLWPETEWDDCVTYVVIDHSNDEHSVGAVVAHELNHSMQAAMDCMEPTAFWENSASYMMLAVYPTSIWYVRYFLESFQLAPHWSVADGNQNSAYWYGGFIWPYFLLDQYAEAWTDAIFLREIWERSMQSSNFSFNEPHYLTAIDEQLKDGGHGDLTQAFHTFSRARYFIDEKMHSAYSLLTHSQELSPTPTMAGTIILGRDEQTFNPPKSMWPKPYGVNYIQLEVPTDYDRNTTFEITTANDFPWHFQLISLTGEPRILEWDSTESRTLVTFDPRPGEQLLLIVEHLGKSSFHPDLVPSSGTEYSILVRPTIGLPDVTGVSPGMVYNSSTVTLNVYGKNFFENATVTFFPDEGFEILDITGSTEIQLKVTVRIPKGVLCGKYSVTVINEDGGSDQLNDAFEVVANPDPDDASDGCSCSQRPGRTPSLVWIWMGLAFFFLRRRLHP